MNKNKQEFYTKILLNKLSELYSAIKEKRVEGKESFEESESDIYDLCQQSYSKEQLYSLCERDRQVLNRVEAALQKLKRGSYGTCEECEKAINEKRLEAIPWVELCIGCQIKKEREVAA